MKITIAKMHGTLGLAILILAASFVSMVEVDNASASVTIATVPVGNPGNAPDPSTGFGEVDYNYNIGKYDVTSSQYTAFLNAVERKQPGREGSVSTLDIQSITLCVMTRRSNS